MLERVVDATSRGSIIEFQWCGTSSSVITYRGLDYNEE